MGKNATATDDVKMKNIRIDDEHHKAAKVQAAKSGKTIREYVEELIEKDKDEKK